MGQLAREVEWAADESGVELRALSTTEAARLLAELAADEAFASADAFEVSDDFGVPHVPELRPDTDSDFDSDFENEPPTQRSPDWSPMADAPASTVYASSATTDDVSPIDRTPHAAPPFVRSLLTVW